MNDLQQDLCQLFAKVLDVDEVGPDDDFFDIGGHSMLAVELVALIRNTYGVPLKVRTFFMGPTVAQMAREIPRQAD